MQSYSQMAAQVGRTTDSQQDPAEAQFLAWFEAVSGTKAPEPIETPEESPLSEEEQFLQWFAQVQGTPFSVAGMIPEPPDPREEPRPVSQETPDWLVQAAKDAIADKDITRMDRIKGLIDFEIASARAQANPNN